MLSSRMTEFLGLMAEELTDRCLFNWIVRKCLPCYDELGLFVDWRLVGGPLR